MASRGAWVFWLCACATPRVGDPGPGLDDKEAEASYQRTFERFTRRGELYAPISQGADTRMFAAATYQSADFRQARVRRTAVFLREPREVVEAKFAAEAAEAMEVHEFFLGVSVVDPAFDDFDRTGSVWRIALVTSGVEVRPEKVERVGKGNLDLRATYRYMDDFWVGYRLRFRRPPEANPSELTLRIASTLGALEWVFPAR